MNIQNTVNSREGLLCAQSEDSGILIQHRTEPRINLREFGIHPFQTERLNTTQLGEGETCSLLTFQTEAVKEKATIEVRTKESIKNNKLTPFVQCKKQTVIARQSLCPLNALIYRDNYPFVQYTKQSANHILHFGSIKLGKPKTNTDNDLQYLTSPKSASAKSNRNTNSPYLTSPILGSAKNNHSSLRGTVSDSAKFFAQCYSEHQGNFSPMIRLPDNIGLASVAQSLGVMPKTFSQIGRKRSPSFFPHGIIDGAHDLINNKTISTAKIIKGILCIIYPLDSRSIPRLSSSLRNKRLTHPDLFSSPSSFIAIVKRSYNSLFNRNCTTYRSFIFSVDIVNSVKLVYYLVDNVLHCLIVSKIMPHSDSAHIGHLTTNDRLFIEVAMYKYTFLIGKGKTRLSEINPIRLISVLAKSENEARLLAGNRHLVFVARQEVAHA